MRLISVSRAQLFPWALQVLTYQHLKFALLVVFIRNLRLDFQKPMICYLKVRNPIPILGANF